MVWDKTKIFFHDIYKYLSDPQHGQCACPAFFPYPHLAGLSLPSLPNCWRDGCLQGHHWPHWHGSNFLLLVIFPCLVLCSARKKIFLRFGEEKFCAVTAKCSFPLEDTGKKLFYRSYSWLNSSAISTFIHTIFLKFNHRKEFKKCCCIWGAVLPQQKLQSNGKGKGNIWKFTP